MILHEIVRALERLEQGQTAILERLKTRESGDEWMQNGIDNILSYQAGKKKEG